MVADLMKGVSIIQGLQPIESCRAFDRNLDESLTVDELVSGVKSALQGCKTGELVGTANGAMFSMWSATGLRGETVSFPIIVSEEVADGVAGASFEFIYPTNVLSKPTCLREETVPAEYEFTTTSGPGRSGSPMWIQCSVTRLRLSPGACLRCARRGSFLMPPLEVIRSASRSHLRQTD